MERRDKINYYLDIAETVSERCTCLRRHFGAILVKNDSILSTGYVGAPRGRRNCSDLGKCIREELHIPRGERYELCRSVHAEANAIIAAPRSEMELVAGTNSCSMCKRLIINAGIETVIVRDTREDYRVIRVQDWVDEDESLEGKFGY